MILSKLLCDSCGHAKWWKVDSRKALSIAKWNLFFHCLRRHMQMPDHRKLICDLCQRAVINNFQLASHIYLAHLSRDEGNFFICDTGTCQQQFYRKCHFQLHIVGKHLLNDAAMERFVCDQCAYSNDVKNVLGQHIVEIHLCKGFQFSCRECDRVFQSHNSLRWHKRQKHRVTNGGNLLMCDFCQKRFTQKHNLIHHVKKAHH